MNEKVYISSKQMATFICPQCKRSKTVSVARYARRKYRRQTNLPARYIHLIDGRKVGQGVATVRDLSAGGMKLRFSSPPQLAVGDLLQVEFRLDDANRSPISKKVIIRNISGDQAGTEFALTEACDKALGFYLFS